MTEWKSVVERRTRMSEIVERASVLCRFLKERSSFCKWKQVSHDNHVLREAFERTVHMGTISFFSSYVVIHCVFINRVLAENCLGDHFTWTQ